jgi:lysine 6-dehydrogenase
MKVLVIGSGRMGYAAAFDLARSPGVEVVTLADQDPKRLTEARDRIRKALRTDSVHARTVLLPEDPALDGLLAEHDACLSAVPYWFNPELARAAVEAGTHFCDLGGNIFSVDAELALDARARSRGVTLIPDCGLAPGMANVVAARAVELLGEGEIERISIRVGGLPLSPKPPLGYELTFSVEGLINEYVEPCRVLRDGEIVEVPGLSEVETLEFPAPFRELEAFQTSGGTSRMPLTYRGRVRDLDYKTIRYPGHAERFRLLVDLGLTSSDPVTTDDGVTVSPRRVLGRLLTDRLNPTGEDVVLVRVDGRAQRSGRARAYRAQLVCRSDEWGRSAMMRTTSDPTSIVAQMMARGRTRGPGAGTPESMVPPGPLLAELAERGIRFEETLDGRPVPPSAETP